MYVLYDINKVLEQMGQNISNYNLVDIDFDLDPHEHLTKEIESEHNIHLMEKDLLMTSRLNDGQTYAYKTILARIFNLENKSFFIDGLKRTGKTFLYHSLLVTLRSQ